MKGTIHRLSRVEAEKLWVEDHKARGLRIIPTLLQKVTDTGGEVLLTTGAKLYRLINGGPKPFAVMGYAHDDSDAKASVSMAR